VFTVKCSRSPQDQTLRTGDCADRSVLETVDPWHGGPVVETHHKLGLKNYSPGKTNHDPHQIGAVCRRHEVDNCGATGLGLKFGFEDEGAGAIMPTNHENRLLRSKQPTT